MVYCFTRDDLPWIDLQHSFCMKLFLDPIVIHRRSVKEHASKKRARERERESDTERSEKEKEMFVCVQLATMPDHACVVERRFFANDSLLKCRRSSSSHGCFARLSMHRVFSTELSIALTDAEDFFKCIQAAVSWEIDRSIERERERELFLGKTVQLLEHVWRPPVVFSQLLEYACRKNLWSSSAASFGYYCSKCGTNPQVCKNLGTWKLIGSSHRLCKLSINSALARLLAPLPRTKSKQKLERRSRRTKKKENQNQKKQKQEEEEEEEYLLRRSKGGFTTSSTSFLTNIVDHNAYRRNRIPEEQLSVEEAASNRSRSQFL